MLTGLKSTDIYIFMKYFLYLLEIYFISTYNYGSVLLQLIEI